MLDLRFDRDRFNGVILQEVFRYGFFRAALHLVGGLGTQQRPIGRRDHRVRCNRSGRHAPTGKFIRARRRRGFFRSLGSGQGAQLRSGIHVCAGDCIAAAVDPSDRILLGGNISRPRGNQCQGRGRHGRHRISRRIILAQFILPGQTVTFPADIRQCGSQIGALLIVSCGTILVSVLIVIEDRQRIEGKGFGCVHRDAAVVFNAMGRAGRIHGHEFFSLCLGDVQQRRIRAVADRNAA